MSEQNTPIPSKKSIAEKELDVLAFWQEKKIFEKSLERPAGEVAKQNFTFYDGPPFATGLPHHGHILAGTMKDVMPRYRTMKGEYVRRVWGWDCHGLPIENMIEKELNLNHKKEIEDYGLDKFNQACFDSVLRYEKDWKKVVPRVGRWVDMEHDYKTMDATYTESIWWSWKQLYEKKLAYEGHKIMHVCPRCETTLAQSEVAQGYKDVTDISVTAKFELVDEPGTFLLAWTTTPWTLPGNTALAVGKDIEYIKLIFADTETLQNNILYRKIIVSRKYLDLNFSRDNDGVTYDFKGTIFTLVDSFLGLDLVNKKYKPIFPYFENVEMENKERIWQVWSADFVAEDTGTGIVHIAPAFGTDDMNLAKVNTIPVIKHVSMSGQFTKEVTDFPELYVKKAGDTQSTDIEIVKYLAHNGKLFAKEKLVHSYPHCWRCETPLLNYATSSWFVDVPKIKDKLVEANKTVNWVPEHIKEGRFGKWLENAHEWAVSRSRYWGAPIPVWKSEDGDVKVIGSFAEMREYMPKAKNTYMGLRHGEANSNVTNTLDCLDDQQNHLTEKGRQQIVDAAQELKNSGVTKIISSPFIRTKETAQILSDVLGIPFETDDRLREINVGEWNRKTITDLYTHNPEFQANLDYVPQGGESHRDARTRAMRVLFDCEKKYEGETVLIVTHGGPIGMLVTGAQLMNDTETHNFFNQDPHADTQGRCLGHGKVYTIPFKPFPNRDGVLDVHRPFIDEIKLTIDDKVYTRVPYVFDCWYESGSMPYAEIHYPFENEQLFKNRFPAEWIGEGLDQTRGWFYSLMVLGVALFDKAPYKNVVVSGMIMASDGQKMSKSKKNFTDPVELIEKFGSDAFRLYVLSSPLVQAENSNFADKELEELYRRVFVRLENVLSFYEMTKGENKARIDARTSTHPLDQWIINSLDTAHIRMTSGLESFNLDDASAPIESVVDDLSVWYVRRSRERLKGDTGEADRICALSTLEYVIQELAKSMAPFTPFIAERMHQAMGGKEESVHLSAWSNIHAVNSKVQELMMQTRAIVSKALDVRTRSAIKVRQPLQKLTIKTSLPEAYLEIIRDEINVKEIHIDQTQEDLAVLDLTITPALKEEGDVRELIRMVQDTRKASGFTVEDVLTISLLPHTENAKVFMEKNIAIVMSVCGLGAVVYVESIDKPHMSIGEYDFSFELSK